MHAYICIVLLFYIQSTFGDTDLFPHNNNKNNDFDNLKEFLLTGYKEKARSTKDHRKSVVVGLSLNQLDLNDELQRMVISSHLYMSWIDVNLVWDPQNYGNFQSMHFQPKEIWTPNIALRNSADGSNVRPQNDWPVWVKNNGRVTWKPHFNANTPCHINLYYWPSDTQKCFLKFILWDESGEEINIHPTKNRSILMDNYQPYGQWKLVKYSTGNPVGNNNGKYTIWKAVFTVKRNANGRMTYISHSTIAVLVIVLLSYILPISFHLSRIVLHIFALFILILCDYIIFLSLPTSGGKIPHVVSYYSGTIVLTALSLVINAILIFLNFNSKSQKLLRKNIYSLLSYISNRPKSQEINYMHLTEEAVITERNGHNNATSSDVNSSIEVADTNFSGNIISEDGHAIVEPIQFQKSPDKYYGGLTIIKTINITLCFIFGIAFVIDYTVMTSMLYHA